MRIKQVILIRKDLHMRRGKEVAQGSHAAMQFLVERVLETIAQDGAATVRINSVERAWLTAGMAKICLRVDSEVALLDAHQRALDAGLTSHLIRDSGKTEFAGVPTLTACAIGPGPSEEIDRVTGTLVPY